MRLKNNRITVVLKTPKSVTTKNWFEKNQGLIQFILVFITLLALAFTIYFSKKSIDISTFQLTQGNKQIEQGSVQLKQASKQLTLAQEQFKESQNQQKKENEEKIYQKSEDQKRFKIQNNINQKNLNAIELQAKIADKQYQAQIESAKDQVYQNRPIFMIQESQYDTIKNCARFKLINIGKRPAKISQSILIAYNTKTLGYKANIIYKDNVELSPSTSSAFFNIQMLKSDYIDTDNTLYYLYFTFEDIVNSKNNFFSKYFQIQKVDAKSTTWSELDENNIQIINKKAKLSNTILKF